MSRKKKDQIEDQVEETTTDEQAVEVKEAEVTVEDAPVVINEELNIGDKVVIDAELPKFKGKTFEIIETGNGIIFIKANGTKYGFKKERATKVG